MARWAEDDRPRAAARTQPPRQDLWYPAIPEDEAPEERAARRAAYAEAVDATRFNLLVFGGAVNSIFVPQLVRAMKDDADGGQAFMDRLLTLTIIIMAALTLVCVLFAPQIVSLFNPNATLANREITIVFARYMLPQIF